LGLELARSRRLAVELRIEGCEQQRRIATHLLAVLEAGAHILFGMRDLVPFVEEIVDSIGQLLLERCAV
jgi:hypothetical protein